MNNPGQGTKIRSWCANLHRAGFLIFRKVMGIKTLTSILPFRGKVGSGQLTDILTKLAG
jgi:hypothetical protein